MTKLIVGALLGLLLGPACCLVGLVLLMNPAAEAEATCSTAPPVDVARLPHGLSVDLRDGTTVTLDRAQLENAATIVTIGGQTAGIGRRGIVVALTAGLTESWLRMLANPSAYPASANHPNDGSGSDNDSLGVFQMRPSAGWGSVSQLMDLDYQTRAFYGGARGPNHGSPRGLLDIPSWRLLDVGAAAQAVEVSAYPDRYANMVPAAHAILAYLTTRTQDRGPFDGTAGATPGCAPCPHAGTLPVPPGAPPPGDGNSYNLGPVSPALRRLVEILAPMFGIQTVGGYRDSARDPAGHPSGNAADFMVPADAASWATSRGRQAGDALAAYAQAHAAELHVDYIIWWQQIWSVSRANEGWRPMENRGSNTENHRDHVHINVVPNAPGNAADPGPLACDPSSRS